MTLEIPGYYYDTAKRKYFRIENSRTAPAEAAWSARNVKRRVEEETEEAAREERLRKHARRVRRTPMRDVPLLGGLLAREAGVASAALGESGGDVLARAWAGGLKAKGGVRLWPQDQRGLPVSSMWIGGSDERSGFGVAYGIIDGVCIEGSYIPRDGDDNINFQYAADRYPHLPLTASYLSFTPEFMGIAFHEPSRKLMVANRGWPDLDICISYFTPRSSSQDDSRPTWVLEDDDEIAPIHASLPDSGHDTVVYSCRAAPWSSRLTCVLGTNQGLAKMQDDKLTWLTPPTPSRRNFHERRRRQRHGESDVYGPAVANVAPNQVVRPWSRDIFSVDFLAQNPADVILAGTRSSYVCVLDLRMPSHEWRPKSNTFRHFSSVTHVRSVGPHSVLAAGPRNAMSLYDIRFLQQRESQQPSTGKKNGWGKTAKSIVEFPEYRNKAHTLLGLDVLTEPGYGSNGIVAAANDDGTVGLYSLQDGTRIASPAVDGIKAPREVKSLVWQTLPRDRHPSLFVGEGPEIKKYSFWA